MLNFNGPAFEKHNDSALIFEVAFPLKNGLSPLMCRMRFWLQSKDCSIKMELLFAVDLTFDVGMTHKAEHPRRLVSSLASSSAYGGFFPEGSPIKLKFKFVGTGVPV